MRRILLLATLALAATMALSVGTAHATAFSCDTGMPAPYGFAALYGQHSLEEAAGNITCTGGTNTGWVVKLTVQYKSSSGTWDFANQPDGNTSTVNMPFGSDDCNPTDHYNNGVDQGIVADFGPPDIQGTCPFGQFKNDADNSDDIWNHANTYDFTSAGNGLCTNGVQGWRVRFIYTDNGNSANTQTSYSNASTC